MVNKSKKMEVNEMIKPNIINGLDLTFSSFLSLFFEEGKFLSLFDIDGFLTGNLIFKSLSFQNMPLSNFGA